MKNSQTQLTCRQSQIIELGPQKLCKVFSSGRTHFLAKTTSVPTMISNVDLPLADVDALRNFFLSDEQLQSNSMATAEPPAVVITAWLHFRATLCCRFFRAAGCSVSVTSQPQAANASPAPFAKQSARRVHTSSSPREAYVHVTYKGWCGAQGRETLGLIG
eukprot:SAG31_NODE_1345_length_8699_cov_7.525116_5_plen_161_part_00